MFDGIADATFEVAAAKVTVGLEVSVDGLAMAERRPSSFLMIRKTARFTAVPEATTTRHRSVRVGASFPMQAAGNQQQAATGGSRLN